MDNHVKNKKYGNFVSISSLTGAKINWMRTDKLIDKVYLNAGKNVILTLTLLHKICSMCGLPLSNIWHDFSSKKSDVQLILKAIILRNQSINHLWSASKKTPQTRVIFFKWFSLDIDYSRPQQAALGLFWATIVAHSSVRDNGVIVLTCQRYHCWNVARTCTVVVD